MPVYWLVFWSVTEVVILVWALWSRRAMYVGRIAVATGTMVSQHVVPARDWTDENNDGGEAAVRDCLCSALDDAKGAGVGVGEHARVTLRRWQRLARQLLESGRALAHQAT